MGFNGIANGIWIANGVGWDITIQLQDSVVNELG